MWNSNTLQVMGSLTGHKSAVCRVYRPHLYFTDHLRQITSMTSSADGKRMVTTSEDGTVICWVMPRATQATVIRHPYSVSKKVYKVP